MKHRYLCTVACAGLRPVPQIGLFDAPAIGAAFRNIRRYERGGSGSSRLSGMRCKSVDASC